MLRYDKCNPETINSAVCFVDILGFSKLVQDSFAAGTGNDLLKRIHKTVTDNIAELKPREKSIGILKAFTDNIVIGYPIYQDGEGQLGSIFLNFAWYQLSLTLEGFFVRGAVSIGDYYGDDEFAFGPALIEAHYLESKEAHNPRIILSDEATKMVNTHIGYYGKGLSPQSRDLLKDNLDGKYFINYLEVAMGDRGLDDYAVSFSILKQHKEIIELNLQKYKDDEDKKIYSKYEWVAQYHNFFSDLNFETQNSQQLKIDNVQRGNFSQIL
ncbi:hypothetical protein ABR775_03335 [Bacillus cereus]|uniref:hypothetical protein n=1 Tax=Bacillus cereus TaxID=1396 RepID=UPI0035563678